MGCLTNMKQGCAFFLKPVSWFMQIAWFSHHRFPILSKGSLFWNLPLLAFLPWCPLGFQLGYHGMGLSGNYVPKNHHVSYQKVACLRACPDTPIVLPYCQSHIPWCSPKRWFPINSSLIFWSHLASSRHNQGMPMPSPLAWKATAKAKRASLRRSTSSCWASSLTWKKGAAANLTRTRGTRK